ncbi:uncharacterized protein TNCV_2460111 [Trichonephila clavipes]|nr:uncharacterized protein TNCV_2460111 [Trichonephila clavipes]
MENTHRRPSGKRPKKRRFRGNQFMKVCPHTYVAERRDTISCCLKCHKPLTINEKSTRGLCSNFEIRCKNCGSVCTFSRCEKTGNKNNAPEINRRSILAMRCIGQGSESLKTFCAVMSLPNPVEQKSYDVINNKLSRVMKEVAEESMKRAAVEENSSSPDNLLTVSGDGTWKTRGHSALIGVCTVIGAETGKVLDREVLSSFCKGCDSYKGVKFGIKYNKWQRAHKISCRKNYSGSAGDGDTKTFNFLSENKPYGDDHLIQKIECVGRVQNRMGTRLRKLKLVYSKKKLSDGKTIGGKGRLTVSLIDRLAHYYGNAIRSNSTSVKEMRRNFRYTRYQLLLAINFTCRNCGGEDRGRVAIYRPFGEVSLSLNHTVTCMVLKANDRRTSCPCHDEFRGPRSDYVRQVALATTQQQQKLTS